MREEVELLPPEVLENQEKLGNSIMAENDALREFGFYIEGVLLVSNEGVSFPNSVRSTNTKFLITKFLITEFLIIKLQKTKFLITKFLKLQNF